MHILIILPNEEVFSVTLICSENITVNFAVLVVYSLNSSLLHIQHLPLSYVF